MDIITPVTRLRLLFLNGIIVNCTCDWMVAMETLERRNIDIADQPDAIGHCIDIWTSSCDHVRTTTDGHNMEQIGFRNMPVHEIRIHNLTMADVVAPVVLSNGSVIMFPDGSRFELDSNEGKRALYRYDRNMHERITQVLDDEQRENLKMTFQRRMVAFIRANYVLNNVNDESETQSETQTLEAPHFTSTPSSKSSSKPTPNTTPSRNLISMPSSSSIEWFNSTTNSSTGSKDNDGHHKLKSGIPLSYLWLIVAAIATALLIMGCASYIQIHMDAKCPTMKRIPQAKTTDSGLWGKVAGKLNIRKQYMHGTTHRTHSKQTFAKNSFALAHEQAKYDINRVQDKNNTQYYAGLSNHILAPKSNPSVTANQKPPIPPPLPPLGHRKTSLATTTGGKELSTNQKSPIPPLALSVDQRRSSLDEGIRNMVTSQRLAVTGGNATPSEESARYFGKFYTDTDSDFDDFTDDEVGEQDLFGK